MIDSSPAAPNTTAGAPASPTPFGRARSIWTPPDPSPKEGATLNRKGSSSAPSSSSRVAICLPPHANALTHFSIPPPPTHRHAAPNTPFDPPPAASTPHPQKACVWVGGWFGRRPWIGRGLDWTGFPKTMWGNVRTSPHARTRSLTHQNAPTPTPTHTHTRKQDGAPSPSPGRPPPLFIPCSGPPHHDCTAAAPRRSPFSLRVDDGPSAGGCVPSLIETDDQPFPSGPPEARASCVSATARLGMGVCAMPPVRSPLLVLLIRVIPISPLEERGK